MHWLLPLLSCLVVASCGFEPVYQQGGQKPGAYDVLQQLHIQTQPGREGDQLKAALEDRFYQIERKQPRYRLEANLGITSRAFIIDPDGISSRYELTAASNYTLIRLRDSKKLHQGTVRRQVSYNVSQDDDYATHIAERDARTRAVDALANDLAARLAALIAKASAH